MSYRRSRRGDVPLPLVAKVLLALRIWRWFVYVAPRVRRQPLPQLIDRLGRSELDATQRPSAVRLSAARLARAVDRSLTVFGRRPTCLVNSLVLYRLLREQGDAAQLVIGLPEKASNQIAHAWVELDGRDVGPPPGRGVHTELARFG
jgi:Transglutaminase-like superfamily